MSTFFIIFKNTIFATLFLFCWHSALGQQLNLMPMPAYIEPGKKQLIINETFAISVEGNFNDRINKEATRFLRRLDQKTGSFFHQHQVSGYKEGASLVIRAKRPGEVKLNEEEAYELKITSDRITLTAETDIGAIRGLETLLQLVDATEQDYYFPEILIKDHPRFAWRGLMLDVARHYMPMDVLYRNLDAMAALKLNVLHLHLSDDQGFRFESKLFPQLTEKGSDGVYYTQQQLKDLVAYADQRGIRVVPEIDVPGHATAILTVFPGLGSKDTTYTIERYSGIFDPTLDPTNEAVYTFLKDLFGEVSAVFPDPYFHIGGDENLGKHWDANQEIQAFKKANQLKTNHNLQTYFNIRLQEILKDLGKQTMGWEEIMTPEMPKTALIHSWRGEMEGVPPKISLFEAAGNGYQTILSNGYYLDLMQPASYHYQVDPLPADMDLSAAARKNILGGEMCMWSELVVPETIDSRLWPRGAAIAERFWSPEEVNDVDDMYRRLKVISLELEQLGLKHLTVQSVILRKLAKSKEIGTLKTLVEVVEPMKGYTRNPGGTLYATYSPFMLWADAAVPDAEAARVFNSLVEDYIRTSAEAGTIRSALEIWKSNHDRLLSVIDRSPVLQEITDLSANLSIIASIGLEAIALLESDQVPEADWLQNSRNALEAARENGGRTELQVVSGIEQLVDQVESATR